MAPLVGLYDHIFYHSASEHMLDMVTSQYSTYPIRQTDLQQILKCLGGAKGDMAIECSLYLSHITNLLRCENGVCEETGHDICCR